MTARELERLIFEIAPPDMGVPNDQNGIVFGDPDAEVRGVAVVWTASPQAIQAAWAAGLNFMLCHEWPWFTSQKSSWFEAKEQWEKRANIARRQLAEKAGLVICRCHSNLDALRINGTVDALARALGFYMEIYGSAFLRIYEIGERTARELAEQVKAKLGVRLVRLAGEGAKKVSRVGLAVGGIAQNWNFIDEFVENGAHAVVVGEAIDYSIRAAVESGLCLIEVGHMASEAPGLREFASLLRERLGGELPVEYLDAGEPWVYI